MFSTFGIRSAKFLFKTVTDAIQWILNDHFNIKHSFHYLDDSFLAGCSQSTECLQALLDILLLCRAINAPVKQEKAIGPSILVTILGIELDSIAMQARLPQDKLLSLVQTL